jgi:hypothetical protein
MKKTIMACLLAVPLAGCVAYGPDGYDPGYAYAPATEYVGVTYYNNGRWRDGDHYHGDWARHGGPHHHMTHYWNPGPGHDPHRGGPGRRH